MKLKLQDYIIIDTPFEYGVFRIETPEQLEQSQSDYENISKFLGTTQEANEIIQLQDLLYKLLRTDENNTQRIDQLKINIKLMISKHKGLK